VYKKIDPSDITYGNIPHYLAQKPLSVYDFHNTIIAGLSKEPESFEEYLYYTSLKGLNFNILLEDKVLIEETIALRLVIREELLENFVIRDDFDNNIILDPNKLR
jgi:hypothetical protein